MSIFCDSDDDLNRYNCYVYGVCKCKEHMKQAGKIIYKKMSLFDAPKDSILVHACNAQGVWGSGIAKEFKSKFPKAFAEYNNYCKDNLEYHILGTALITKPENTYKIGCLINSSDFGARLSAEKLILDNTKHSLEKLVTPGMPSVFYSNKFNSGYFKVPWEKTEKLIQDFITKYNIDWIVCDPSLGEEKWKKQNKI